MYSSEIYTIYFVEIVENNFFSEKRNKTESEEHKTVSNNIKIFYWI